MINHDFSSGDLNADRRASYARSYAQSADFSAAAELQSQALELAPAWAAGWYELGNYLEKAGDITAAAEAWREALKHSPTDVFGAGLKLSLTGQAEMPPVPPSEYVEALFDDYAGRFDKALLEKLEYCAPERLLHLLLEVHASQDQFARVIDLGCGTGLFGERVRRLASWLEGYDLSQGMLSVADAKGIYDHLEQADIGIALQTGPLAPSGQADLVAAADVFAYFGDLSAVMQIATGLLKPGGLLGFTCEAGQDVADWLLQPSLRYCHSANYLMALAEKSGLQVEKILREPLRKDGGKTIYGYFLIARKRPAATAMAESHLACEHQDTPMEEAVTLTPAVASELN